MLGDSKAFSSFSVSDVNKAKEFYSSILGLKVTNEEMGNLTLHLGSGAAVMVYPKGGGHQPASFTVLNFPVSEIDKAVDELSGKGITFEQYDNEWIKTDDKGIARSDDLAKSPHMAWFKDPDGNILAVMQTD